MSGRRRIVVGVDGGYDGLRATEYAAHEAESQGRGVRLIHAYHVSAALNPMLPLYGVQELRDYGEQALERAARLVTERTPDVPVDHFLVQASPARALVQASRSAAMVVVGRRHIHGVERVLSGSTSTAVAARAKAPVVSVSGSWSFEHNQRPIVVGADGSPQARDALAFGFAEASQRGSPLMVVRVWEMPSRWYSDNPPLEREMSEWFECAQLALAEDLAGWSELYPDVHVSRLVEHSPSPADVLVSRSRGSGLVVVGARGHGGVPGLDLGWTARTLLAHAHAPVAVIHQGSIVRPEQESLVPVLPAAAH